MQFELNERHQPKQTTEAWILSTISSSVIYHLRTLESQKTDPFETGPFFCLTRIQLILTMPDQRELFKQFYSHVCAIDGTKVSQMGRG